MARQHMWHNPNTESYALLAMWVGVTVHWIDTYPFFAEASPKNSIKVVSNIS